MKKLLLLIIITSTFSQVCFCQEKRECVLDNITHVEDSVYYQIDSLPMLCNELGMKGKLVDIGDCKLYCELSGAGIPMVVINGGPGGTHHCFHPWFNQAEKFCTVVYYDQRGCGQSDFKKGDGYTFRQAVDDLDKLRQKLGIEKWIVCGYSYGGALAQFYTTQYPDHVLGMVLIGSATLFKDPAFDQTRQFDFISKEEKQQIDKLYGMYRKGELNLFQLIYNKDLSGDWKRQNFYKPTRDELVRQTLYEWVNDKGFNHTVGSDYQRYDLKNAFNANPIPTLICEGKWDLTWGAEKSKVFKQNHPNAQLMLFENAGHTIFSEEPELFFSTLKTFVTTLKPISNSDIKKWKADAAKIIEPQVDLFAREAEFFILVNEKGVDKACEYYSEHAKADKLLFTESGLNSLGYRFLSAKDYDSAIKLLTLYTKAYPNSWNAYDSLAEAYLKSGDKENAKKFYQKTLRVNPDASSAKEALAKLNGEE